MSLFCKSHEVNSNFYFYSSLPTRYIPMSLCIPVNVLLFTYISFHTLCSVRITAVYLSLYFSVKFHFVLLESADVHLLDNSIFAPLLLLSLLPFLYSLSFTAAFVPFCFTYSFYLSSSIVCGSLLPRNTWLSLLCIRPIFVPNLFQKPQWLYTII